MRGIVCLPGLPPKRHSSLHSAPPDPLHLPLVQPLLVDICQGVLAMILSDVAHFIFQLQAVSLFLGSDKSALSWKSIALVARTRLPLKAAWNLPANSKQAPSR